MPTLFLRRVLRPLVALAAMSFAGSAHATVELETSAILEGVRHAGEMLVHVRNPDQHAVHGTITLESDGIRRPMARRPFEVGPGANVFVKVPVGEASSEGLVAVARDAKGAELASAVASPRTTDGLVLFTIAPHDAPLETFHVGANRSPVLRRTGMPVTVSAAHVDEATGAPILPERPGSYAHAAMVLVPAAELEALEAASRDVLLAWVRAGGTLAVSVRTPEDLAHPVLESLVGRGVRPAPFLPPPDPPQSEAEKEPRAEEEEVPVADAVVRAKLTGYAGGRVRPSSFGAVAEVGLGNVHLLAIDPWSKPANGDRWVQSRIVGLADESGRTAIARTSFDGRTDDPSIFRALDANESFRPALALATLLLVLYAVGVGPFLFRRLARRGPVLAPYRWTALASATTFGIVVVTGLVAKGGFGRRSRELAIVEAASGESVAFERRFTGFYASSDAVVDVAESMPSSSFSRLDEQGAFLATSAEGASRLEHVPVRPWETSAIHEDATIGLGKGITIAHEGSDLVVTNRSGARLVGVVLSIGDDRCLDLGTLTDGATVRARDAKPIDPESCTSETKRKGWAPFRAAFANRPIDGRPILFAELDVPRTADTGFRLERQTTLVRIVGGAS